MAQPGGPITANSRNEWRQGVPQGWRPAVNFNATLVESGEPLPADHHHLLPKNQSQACAAKNLCPVVSQQRTFRVVTAVRLAAAFSFCNAAARGHRRRPSAPRAWMVDTTTTTVLLAFWNG